MTRYETCEAFVWIVVFAVLAAMSVESGAVWAAIACGAFCVVWIWIVVTRQGG